MTEPDPQVQRVADLINHLFDVRRHADGRPYTNREVGAALHRANPGAHIAKLRNGRIRNPTRETLLVVCRVFRVAPAYFFPELEQEGVSFAPVPPVEERQ